MMTPLVNNTLAVGAQRFVMQPEQPFDVALEAFDKAADRCSGLPAGSWLAFMLAAVAKALVVDAYGSFDADRYPPDHHGERNRREDAIRRAYSRLGQQRRP